MGHAAGSQELRRGAALVVLAATLWAGIGPLAQPLLDRGLSPAAIAFWRAAIGGGCFVVHAVVVGARPRHRVGELVGFGLVGVGVFYMALPAAIDAGGISLAWVLLYTAPVWVVVVAPRVIGEAADRGTVALVALTMVGIALVAAGGGDGVRVTGAAVAWGVTAGWSYATWYLIVARTGARPVVIGTVALPVGALVLAPFGQWPEADATIWALLVALGVVSTYVPALAYYAGMGRIPAARGAVLATVEPVVALVFAAVLFGERLALVSLAGAGVVVTVAAMAAMPGRLPDREA